MTEQDELFKELEEAEKAINSVLGALVRRNCKVDVEVIEHGSFTYQHPTPIISTKVFRQEY